MKFHFVAFAHVLCLTLASEPKTTTPEPELVCQNGWWDAHRSSCPKTCDNYPNGEEDCSLRHVSHCVCHEGYILKHKGSAQCIKPQMCGSVRTDCLNGRFQFAGVCPLTCDNYLKRLKKFCNRMLETRCVCNDGYILKHKESDQCVKPQMCGSARTVCKNGRWMSGQSACPVTCDNYAEGPKNCTSQHVARCICDEGYILEHTCSTQCIRPEKCPVGTICQNGRWMEGDDCPETCKNYPKPSSACSRLVDYKQCICHSGFILKHKRSKHCIKPEMCGSGQ